MTNLSSNSSLSFLNLLISQVLLFFPFELIDIESFHIFEPLFVLALEVAVEENNKKHKQKERTNYQIVLKMSDGTQWWNERH